MKPPTRQTMTASIRNWNSTSLLRAPIFGRVTRGLNTARFTRTLSILTASGVPALEALRISASVIANLPMRTAVEDAAVRVREGGAIGRSLAQSKLFPPMVIHLISSGEASGERFRGAGVTIAGLALRLGEQALSQQWGSGQGLCEPFHPNNVVSDADNHPSTVSHWRLGPSCSRLPSG